MAELKNIVGIKRNIISEFNKWLKPDEEVWWVYGFYYNRLNKTYDDSYLDRVFKYNVLPKLIEEGFDSKMSFAEYKKGIKDLIYAEWDDIDTIIVADSLLYTIDNVCSGIDYMIDLKKVKRKVLEKWNDIVNSAVNDTYSDLIDKLLHDDVVLKREWKTAIKLMDEM